MTPEPLSQIGTTPYSDLWQSNLAQQWQIDARRIRPWLNQERPIPEWLTAERTQLLQPNISHGQACLNIWAAVNHKHHFNAPHPYLACDCVMRDCPVSEKTAIRPRGDNHREISVQAT